MSRFHLYRFISLVPIDNWTSTVSALVVHPTNRVCVGIKNKVFKHGIVCVPVFTQYLESFGQTFKTPIISFDKSVNPSHLSDHYLPSSSVSFGASRILRTPLPDDPAGADQTWLDLSNQQIMTLHPSIHRIHAPSTGN